ncbi:MAG TPA: glycerol-3-phosphate 1-O-acyltransferase PlsY [Sedimentisphaerales bacterium]|nr:glycerol-3-phosphate 1-O-acyltransferase PlsY [Sedimentisphaerales bacterium]
MLTDFIILILCAYLLGSLPFGLIIAFAHGKDLRTIGSKNIGATNLARALGRKWAYFCFCLDMLKGLLPMLLATKLAAPCLTISCLLLVLTVGLAAVSGHIFPIYLKFKGGKGVATTFGMALGLWPYYTICALVAGVVWTLVVVTSGYISLASIVASLAFPLALLLAIIMNPNWDFAVLWPLFTAATAIPLIVIIRHRQNIKRILAGTETKIRKLARNKKPKRL